MRTQRSSCAWLALLIVVACGPGDEPSDGDAGSTDSGAVDAAAACVTGGCDDGIYCNGAERCAPSEPGADARGCVDGTPPCGAPGAETCDEAAGACTACEVDADGDGDGARAIACGGDDCDDNDPSVYPGAAEICDAEGLDEDCDPTTFGDRDIDRDGEIDTACFNVRESDGMRFGGRDCDDNRISVNPTASEVCDGFDNNCDGEIDEGTTVPGFTDADRDGYGDESMPRMACAGTRGFAIEGGDCDDTRAEARPGWIEICDGLDNDCDGEVDEAAVPIAWYVDADGDGWGVVDEARPTMLSCEPVPGRAIRGGDCDDDDPMVNPGAPERCNGRDDDCDGLASFFIAPGDTEDDDRDGLADMACGAGASDCDDRDPFSGGASVELCDGRDNDCDGRVDEMTAPVSWYEDADGDGYGRDAGALSSCEIQQGRVLRAGDCDDTNPLVSPGALDGCGGTAGADDDCDGTIDEDVALTAYYPDADGDGWGVGATIARCGAPAGHAESPGDCAPNDATRSPGATESCTNGIDDDCDELVDCDDPSCDADPVCVRTARLSIASGDGQSARVHALTSSEVVVRVTDLAGTASAGVQVRCESIGGASCDPLAVTTDGSGAARFRLRAAPFPGSQRVRLAAPGARSVFARVTATAPPPGTIYTLVNVQRTSAAGDASDRAAADVTLNGASARAVAVGSDGVIYVALHDDHGVLRIDGSGRATRLAGTGVQGSTGDGGLARDARVGWPLALALDEPNRRLLVSTDTSPPVVRTIDLDGGFIDAFAGGGAVGGPSYGDGGSATSAAVRAVSLAVELDGSVLLSDGDARRLRRVDPAGLIREVPAWTAAGTTAGAVAIGPAGRPLLLDWQSSVVLRGERAGGVEVLAGSSTGSSSDGVPARLALLGAMGSPSGLVVAPSGNVFFADPSTGRVRRVERTTSLVTTVAGTGTPGAGDDHVPGPSSALEAPRGIALHPDGHLIIADGNTVRVVWGPVDAAPATVNVELTGGGGQTAVAFSDLPAPIMVRARTAAGAAVRALRARFASEELALSATPETSATGVASASATAWVRTGAASVRAEVLDLYGEPLGPPVVASATITAPAAGTIHTILNRGGTGATFAGEPRPAMTTNIGTPFALVSTSAGELYVGANGVRLHRISATGTVEAVDTSGVSYSQQRALAYDAPRGLVYFLSGGRLAAYDSATGATTLVAGGGTSQTGGDAFSVSLQDAYGLAADVSGRVYVSRCYTAPNWLIDPAAGLASVFLAAGDGDATLRYDGGCYTYPPIAVLPDGDVVIASAFSGPGVTGSTQIVRIDEATGAFSLLADASDGISSNVQGLLPDGMGGLYFSDRLHHRVMRLDLTTGALTRIAGSPTGSAGATGDGGPATSATLSYPYQLAFLDGHLVIADENNSRIRLVW